MRKARHDGGQDPANARDRDGDDDMSNLNLDLDFDAKPDNTAASNQRQPGDHAVRLQALDPAESFLVQAPAGSGKTELLTDRILALLATVDQPEEILAITFTRKAAAEMHERVLTKLRAGLDDAPQEAFRRRSWELARAAMQRDAQQGWNLLQHPARLGIRTIDAYCAQLVRAMPWLSALGGTPAITDDAQAHYQAAARATLAMIDDVPAVAAVVAHLDVDLRIAESLIAAMLGSRDQWLPLLQQGADVDALSACLRKAVCADLRSLAKAMPLGWADDLAGPLRTAAQTLSQEQSGHVLEALCDWDGRPLRADVDDLPRWKALADALLTKDGGLRKSLTKALGFPPKSVHKEVVTQWLSQADPDAAWLALLARARDLPAGYDAAQRDTLHALLMVLRLAAANLKLRFSEQSEVDFIEIAQSAALALGSADDPGELLLRLDARLRHILVDEFQDTSQPQIELLQALTSGWQPGDGRTLFLVGDPMQSIYRFRKAEVGWFLRVKEHGLGEVALTPLNLTDNFRSRAGVVDWVNRVFQPLFPRRDDPVLGAIRYTPSRAFQPGEAGEAVQWHPVWMQGDDTADADAAAVQAEELAVRLAQDAMAQRPDSPHPVAILVRARSHLRGIVRRLAQQGVPCRAVELESLQSRQVVSDLAQLARALSHPADRLAWLSVLRSPLCGLTLASLHALAGHDHRLTIPALMARALRDDLLPPDEGRRLRHAAAALLDGGNRSGAVPFAAWVEHCWQRLGGPLAYPDPDDQADVEQVLRLIERLAPFGDLDLAQFAARLETLYAAPGGASRAVEVMTIHKSKGLEFDTVILAGLHRRPRGDQAQLVRFEYAEGDLLLGPMAHRVSDKPDPVSAYLAEREKQRSRYETDRLLYVAVTRARNTLHLIGELRADAGGNARAPAGASLLGRLWPSLASITPPAVVPQHDAPSDAPADLPTPAPLLRLPLSCLSDTPALPMRAAPTSWQWQPDSLLERLAGTVAHEWLERLGAEDADVPDADAVLAQTDAMRRQLSRAGLPAAQLDAGVALVRDTLAGALRSERGRWLLGQHHAQREWALLDAQGRVSVIDLAVSDAQGWLVVDYKTGAPGAGEAADDFLARMRVRYAEQLARYCVQLRALDGRPARGALFFPRAGLWLDVPEAAA